MNIATGRKNIPAGTTHRSGVHIRSVQLDVGHKSCQRSSHGTGPTAKVDDDCSGPRRCENRRWHRFRLQETSGLIDKQLCAAPRNKDPGLHGNSQATKPGPPQDVLQRKAGGPPLNGRSQLHRTEPGCEKEFGLFLGIYTACGTKPGDDGRKGWKIGRHGDVLRLSGGRPVHD
jgi:hypothetical protein